MKKKRQIDDPIHRELDAIKRLMILQLLKSGTSQSDIAKALAIDPADLSRMMPARQFKSNSASK